MIADGFTYVSVLIFFASFILAAERATGWAVFRVIPGVVFIYAGSMLLSTLGLWGMAAADTLLAAVAANASVRGGLIPVLLLPSMLPILLPAIALTAGEGEPALLGGMLIYDMALTVGASMLFDSLWIES